jgi:hypothetical protein
VLRIAVATLAMAIFAAPAAASAEPDPLRSVMWDDMRALILGGGPVVFDERVRVVAPASAEDALWPMATRIGKVIWARFMRVPGLRLPMAPSG